MPGLLSAAQLATITATVASSLDVALTFNRNTKGQDTYGHTTQTGTTVTGTYNVNVFKPSASQLQTFASVIGTKKATMIRFLSTSDIQEGDTCVYHGKTWLVQYVLDAESYSVALDALLTEIQ